MHAKIRRAGLTDCAALLALIHQHAHFERSTATISLPELEGILVEPSAPVSIFVATHESLVLAYAAMTLDYSLWRSRIWAHLDCLFVAQRWRGHGLGAALLKHVHHAARALGADRLEWQTPDWNARAIAFYRREGADCSSKTRFFIEL